MVDTSIVPPLLIISVPVLYIAYKVFVAVTPAKAKPYDPKTGIGRGAPGFQTGVRRVAIPPALAARIRAGEEVSAEEVTVALEAEKERVAREEAKEQEERQKLPPGVDEDWLPAGAAGGKNKSKAKKRK
ncbi:hypothetical protein JCM10213_000080 [Rhodosporidiobolus nylandii]